MRIKALKPILLIVYFSCLISIYSNAQHRQEFVFDNLLEGDSIHFVTYKYTRIYLSDSVFQEVGLFNRDTLEYSASNIFKIQDEKWYFRQNRKYQIFFDSGRPIKSVITISG